MVTDCAIVTVRNSSTRLPGKALLATPAGRTIEVVIQRALKIGVPVILATSVDPGDDPFAAIGQKWSIDVFRGALANKLRRWRDCFQTFGVERAVLVDGDDLAYDYDIGRRALAELAEHPVDIIVHPEDVVCGFFTYALHVQAFAKLQPFLDNENTDTDVISEYLRQAGLHTRPMVLHPWERHQMGTSPFRLTLDYPEDLAFFKQLLAALGPVAAGQTIIRYLEAHPEVAGINQHRQQAFVENQRRFNDQVRAHWHDGV